MRDREVVTQTLTSHAQAVARRLRHDAVQGRTVTVKIKLARARRTARSRVGGEDGPDYPLLTRSKTLPHPTDDGAVIRKVAIALWDAAAIAEPVRLLGVSVSQMSSSAESQLELFASDEVVRARKLGPAVDSIRERFGAGAIRQGTGDPEKLTPSLRKKRGV